MRLVLILAALLGAAPGAHAATVAGQLVDGRLELRFRAAPGERNELGMVPHESGVRFAGSASLVPGPHCRAVREGDVRCGPTPPGGLAVHARTGDRDDFVFARVAGIAIETLRLGRGNDQARGNGYMAGDQGKDDQLAGGFGPDAIFAGPGNDRIRATDPKGDVIRCGPGRDVAYVSRRDRTTGCERIVLGWPS